MCHFLYSFLESNTQTAPFSYLAYVALAGTEVLILIQSKFLDVVW